MRNKVVFKLLLTFFLIFAFQMSSYAILDLELTQGVDSAIPIAIVPFQNQNGTKAPVDVSQIVSSDLQNSGQFKVLDQSLMTQYPRTVKAIDFGYWRTKNMNNLVIGNVLANGNNQYQVDYNLLDIYKGQASDPSTSAILNQQYHVRASMLRAVAHKISDQIYQKLVGVPGIFSTKIAYVLVKRIKAWPVKDKFYLEVADADGFNPQAILISSEPIMSLAWSPDGRKIAYVSFENRRAAIYVSDVMTGRRTLITHFPEINGAPAWSPDETKMAVVLSRGESTKIFLLDMATKKLTQFTKGWAIDTEPSFAPDGKSIIFTSDRGGHPQIYQKYLESGKVQRLTFTGDYNARASFTADGKKIVMLHRDHGEFNIAVQNLQTGVVTVLTKSGNDQSPAVSANGQMIIYATNDKGRGELGMVSLDGRVSLTLPETNGIVRNPIWSPYFRFNGI